MYDLVVASYYIINMGTLFSNLKQIKNDIYCEHVGVSNTCTGNLNQ